jgi:hypothetical protein
MTGAHKLAERLGLFPENNRYAHMITSLDSIQGKTGIIYFENYHIDLWNKNTMVGNGDDEYDEKMYFLEVK